MTAARTAVPTQPEIPTVKTTTPKAPPRTLLRVLRYTLLRGLTLFAMVALSVYLTILVANGGGYVDLVIRNRITESINGRIMGGWLRDVSLEERQRIVEETTAQMEEAAGLNEPFMVRALLWLGQGITLGWGRSWTGGGYVEVRQGILDALPKTLFMFGTANLLLFFTTVFGALTLTRRPESWLNKLVNFLSPLSAVPAWLFGILLSTLALQLGLFRLFGGELDAWPEEFSLAYIPILLRHLVFPVGAIFASKFFQSMYAWRTFFLLYETEPYVEMARIKGLHPRVVERRYILRTALPAVITSFALLMIGMWQEVIILEQFFRIQGIGRLFVSAVQRFSTPMVVGCVTMFGYLLAISIFVLDIVYALVDPRITVGSTEQTAGGPVKGRQKIRRWHGPTSLARSRDSARVRFHLHLSDLGTTLRGARLILAELVRSPSAFAGLAFIIVLTCVSVATVAGIPYQEATRLWGRDAQVWANTPNNAPPAWVNLFRENDMPETIVLDSRDGTAAKSIRQVSATATEIVIAFPFDYPYEDYPEDVSVRFSARYAEKRPFVALIWVTPDGVEDEIASFSAPPEGYTYHMARDETLLRQVSDGYLGKAFYMEPAAAVLFPEPGRYELRARAIFFEPDVDLDAEFVLGGRVYGLAGTDSNRRDLMLALLWGTPIALAFGFIGAIGTSLSTMLIAAISTWFGGRVDSVLQRITEMNMILPFFPLAMMVFLMYSSSLWVMLAVAILFNIFGSGIKTYRALFLQIKQAPYIEAARAYGASDWRIIFRYLIPRVAVLLIPQLIFLVPTYVFLEPALASVGITDPYLPSWGKLVVESFTGIVQGDAYKAVPALVLVLTGYSFAAVGFALERIARSRLQL